MEYYQIGIDVGGTFTDLVAAGGPESVYLKVPTPADDQALGVHAGLERLAARLGLDRSQLLARTARIVHGTTVATNMMIEGTGSRVGLLTTAGFRDELEYRRGLKETIYDPRLRAPRSLARRRDYGVVLSADGYTIDREGTEAERARRKEKGT
jgi:N-methylhydantoinase A